MGLDQYAYTRTFDQSKDNVQYEFIWRKHAQLQTWMEDLFTRVNCAPAEDLNCGELELTLDDIAKLERDLQDRALPRSEGGFFFGHQFQDESAREYREQDLEFCTWARNSLRSGKRVFYSCWW